MYYLTLLNMPLHARSPVIIKSLIPIKPVVGKRPLYIVCGSGGTVFTFREFAKLLDADQPVYVLQQPSGIEDVTGFPDTIEHIAARYIEEIMVSNPYGPYALSGHCLGGIIAFEMAIQLTAMGKEVSTLAMLDTVVQQREEVAKPSLNNYFHIPAIVSKLFSKAIFKIKFELFLLFRHPKQAIIYKLRNVRLIMRNSQLKAEDIYMEIFNKISAKLERAAGSYEIKGYDGGLIVFYAKQHYFFTDRENNVLYKKLIFSDEIRNGWNKHAKTVKIYEIDGDHSTIFEARNAEKFAKILQQHLNESSL